MENRIHQKRLSFSDTQTPKHHVSSGSRNDNAWNWLQRIAFHVDDMGDDEHVTSVAAAAFAIHSLEEAESRDMQKMREIPKSSRTQTMRRKEDNLSRRPSNGGEISMKMSFGQDPRTKVNALPVRRPSATPSPTPMHHKSVKTKPGTWEKAMMEKIQNWCKKIKSKILSWECVKKIQAKHQMKRKKRALEHRRAMEKQNYGNKIGRENMIAQLEEKRRKQESEARVKENKIQKTGKVPVKCSCCNSY
ncbi:putative remorin, tetratricopeptide-like helical domain-containing protein [Lupinus albus]|uniref:Putative remorin, tetratricopeptide-like helical domain-containing protein n=1 Tax=Lupinus albus TaxID=3870 RepID=A0A6A4PK78_LUPAL|nr:putative remorin, tetratricopeptide-like helical domain-containing protein [Lupinus albus]